MNAPFEQTTLLFAAGHRPDRFAKALALAPFVCIDLEDSVPDDRKAASRADIARFLATQAQSDLERLAVRISHPDTEHGPADIAMLARLAPSQRPRMVMVPMTEQPETLTDVANALALGDNQLIALIETPIGIKRAFDIAATPQTGAVMFGGGDFAACLGVAMDWEPLFLARSEIVMAAAAAGKAAIDVPFLDISDPDGLERETARIRALGFSAKAAIHPKQVAPIAAAFRPTAEELLRAERIVAAFEASDGGAQLLDGQMIEEPVVARARRQLKQAG